MKAIAIPPDMFVGSVSIGLGLLCLSVAVGGSRWFHWSRMAVGLETWGGRRLVAIVYGTLALFLLFVGLSLFKR